MKGRNAVLLTAVTAMGLALVACGDDDDSGSSSAECPSTLTIQTDWFPELEHGGTYQLIGTNGEISKDNVNYSGPVQEQYKVPGLENIAWSYEQPRPDAAAVASLIAFWDHHRIDIYVDGELRPKPGGEIAAALHDDQHALLLSSHVTLRVT